MFEVFIQKVSGVASSAKSFADSVIDSASSWTKDATTYVTQKYDDAKEAVTDKMTEAQWEVFNLETKKAEVDFLISNMEDIPQKADIKKQRDESRSLFMDKVAPLINKLLDEHKKFEAVDFNGENKYSNFAGNRPVHINNRLGYMSALPVVPVVAGVSVVAVCSALIYWCKKAYALEEAIASDPTLTAHQKAQLISQTGIQGAIRSAVPALLIGVVGLGVYLWSESK